MSVVSQFFTTPTTQKKQNRRIFLGETSGPTSNTWRVPPGVTEVEVHVWGGGGNALAAVLDIPGAFTFTNGGAGGGGGYVTHVYPVSTGDVLSFTIGGPAGTSSVTVPTQSPGSPISATGGLPGSDRYAPIGPVTFVAPGGSGGSGSYNIAPGVSTSRTFAASGGSGGNSAYIFSPTLPSSSAGGGGGGAGFIYGPGGNGADLQGPNGYTGGGGGGGIKGSGSTIGGGGGFMPAPGSSDSFSNAIGGAGIGGNLNYDTDNNTVTNNSDWFYLTDVKAVGASKNSRSPTAKMGIPATAGGGGSGVYSYVLTPSPVSYAFVGGDAGLWGGGGGGFTALSTSPTTVGVSRSGYAGGAGGAGPSSGSPSAQVTGGAGIIIIYW